MVVVRQSRVFVFFDAFCKRFTGRRSSDILFFCITIRILSCTVNCQHLLLPHPAPHAGSTSQDSWFVRVEMIATEESVSFSSGSSSILHGNLFPSLEIRIILVRIFLVQADSRAADSINLHDIGLTATCSASVNAVHTRSSSAGGRWGVETSRASVVNLRVCAKILISQVRS
jgi:hypothetical protein